jgi:hypothetical protein
MYLQKKCGLFVRTKTEYINLSSQRYTSLNERFDLVLKKMSRFY